MVACSQTVMVVEDDEGMRRAVERLLAAAGFTSRGYASAEEALAARPDAEAACVVSDLRLPELSGLDLLRVLRAQDAAPPLILIMAHDAPRRREAAVRAGAAGYLAKPFPGTELVDLVRELIQPAGPS